MSSQDGGFTLRTYSLTVAPGAESVLAIYGSYLACLESNQTEFRVRLNDGSLETFFKGLKVRMAGGPLIKLAVENPNATDLAVELAIGSGDIDDARLAIVGGVPVRGAGAAFTHDGAVSIGVAAVQLSAINLSRSRAIVQAGGLDLWLGPTNAVAAAGAPTVPAGGVLDVQHTGALWGIRAAGTTDAGFLEETV